MRFLLYTLLALPAAAQDTGTIPMQPRPQASWQVFAGFGAAPAWWITPSTPTRPLGPPYGHLHVLRTTSSGLIAGVGVDAAPLRMTYQPLYIGLYPPSGHPTLSFAAPALGACGILGRALPSRDRIGGMLGGMAGVAIPVQQGPSTDEQEIVKTKTGLLLGAFARCTIRSRSGWMLAFGLYPRFYVFPAPEMRYRQVTVFSLPVALEIGKSRRR